MQLAWALLLALTTSVAAHPAPEASQVEKRQDYSALIALASSAGISLPTSDPAALLSIAPVAAALASYLPTAPVLSALETAAPSGFISNIIHDASYAASFESQFAAGNSPSWFLALPTSVKSYLHTYSGYVPLATQIASAEGIVGSANAKATSAAARASSGGAVMMTTRTETEMAVTASTGRAAGSESAASSSSVTASSASSSSAATAAAAAAASTSASTAGAARETAGALAAALLSAVGVLGLAVAL